MRDALTGSWEMMATAWRVDWRKTTVALVLMVAGAAAAPLLAAALGRMTSEAAAGQAAAAVVTGAAVAGLAIASLTFSHFAHIAYSSSPGSRPTSTSSSSCCRTGRLASSTRSSLSTRTR